jgi:putative oxidoreductase
MGITVQYLQNFDVTNQMNVLRLICGLFLIPHIYAKFFVPEALGFFVASGLEPPKVWLYVACVIEIIVTVGLVFVIFPFFAALLGAVHLLVAMFFVWKVTRGKWLWNIGGCEYCLFWAICCLIVAMNYYRSGHLFM